MSHSPTGDQTEARKFTRRQFVGRAAALGLSVSALPALSGLLDPVVAAASTRAPDRKRGRILRIGETGNFENFDPQSEPGGDWPFFNQLYGSLSRDTMQPNAGASEMWLASGYKFGPGYKYVDITLRDGVKFIDGSPLNSAALLANLKKIMNPVTGRDAYANWATIISNYRAVDEKTTRLYFKGVPANEYIRELISRMELVSPQLIAQGENALDSKASGTGAFALASYEPGSLAVMTRNPYFWKQPLPYLDSIEFHFFTDANAMTSTLLSGGLDMVIGLPPQFIKSLTSSFKVINGPKQMCFEVISSTRPGRPFERKAARQALQYLIDRERFSQQIMFGTGEVAWVHVAPTSIGWEVSFTKRYSYDPDLAKAKFKALGMLGKKPIEIVQLTGVYPLIGDLAEMVAGEMNDIGLNAALKPVDTAGWLDVHVGAHAGDYDMIMSFMGRGDRYPVFAAVGNPALEPIGNPAWANGKPPAAYSNAFTQLQHAQTPADQRKWALAMEECVLDESWDIAVSYQSFQYAMDKNLMGFANSRDDWIQLDAAYFA
jgi:peptide/nickel transport system substrate-binding protein